MWRYSLELFVVLQGFLPAMTSTNAVKWRVERLGRVAAHTPSGSLHIPFRGIQDHSVKPRYRNFERFVGRGILSHFSTRQLPVCNSAEPDWDAEMSLFRKRTMKPNQMQTVRRLEEQVDIGKVGLSGLIHGASSVLSSFMKYFALDGRCFFRMMVWLFWRA